MVLSRQAAIRRKSKKCPLAALQKITILLPEAPHRLRAKSRPARPRGRLGTPPGGSDISSVPFKRTDTREGAIFKNTGGAVRKRAPQLGSMRAPPTKRLQAALPTCWRALYCCPGSLSIVQPCGMLDPAPSWCAGGRAGPRRHVARAAETRCLEPKRAQISLAAEVAPRARAVG